MRFLKFGGRKDQPQTPPPVPGHVLFDLDQPLLLLGGEAFTVRNATEGVQVFGGTGSGKTSGSGRTLALSYLACGFGGLVLCAKPEERRLWEELAKATGREGDLVIFDGVGKDWRFNFIDYEKNHSGEGAGLTINIVQLITDVVRAIDREDKEQGEKPFWKNALRQLTTAVIELASFAGLPLRFDLLSDIVRSGPGSIAQWNDPAWQEGILGHQFSFPARYFWFVSAGPHGEQVLNRAGYYYALLNAALLFITVLGIMSFYSVAYEVIRIANARTWTQRPKAYLQNLNLFRQAYIFAKLMTFAYAINIGTWVASPLSVAQANIVVANIMFWLLTGHLCSFPVIFIEKRFSDIETSKLIEETQRQDAKITVELLDSRYRILDKSLTKLSGAFLLSISAYSIVSFLLSSFESYLH